MSEANPFFAPEPKKKPNIFVNLLQILVIITSICIVLYLFVLTPNQVDGPSMQPNYYTGQLLLTNRLVEWIGDSSIGRKLGMDYKRGDVIILQKPGLKTFVKRIIGMPGDHVSIRECAIYINNKRLIEDYISPTLCTNGGDFIVDGGEGVDVPQGSYIAIGDNRPVSNDSRYSEVALIKRAWIKGRVILRFYPFDKFNTVSTGKYSFEDSTRNF